MALGSSGAIYVGVNLEFPKAQLNNSVHAEQFLIVNALQHGEQGLELMAISEAPCGHCRQFFTELACANKVRICGNLMHYWICPDLIHFWICANAIRYWICANAIHHWICGNLIHHWSHANLIHYWICANVIHGWSRANVAARRRAAWRRGPYDAGEGKGCLTAQLRQLMQLGPCRDC